MLDDLPLAPVELWAYVIAVPLLIVGVYAAVRWSIIGVVCLALFFGAWLAFGLGCIGYAIWHHIPAGNWFAAAFLIAFGCFMLAPMVQMISHTLRKRR
jgi:hypothetical protein